MIEGDNKELSFHSEPTPFILASAHNQHIITGRLIEIDKLNNNGWGIPREDVETIKAGLLGVPLKICSGEDAIFNEHSCDYSWDPNAEIGQIISAHQEDGWIHVAAKVTDPVAQSKLDSDTWVKKWSVFGGYKSEDENKMRHGTVPKSVTLVKNPAYTGAIFKNQAASQSSQKERDNMAGKDDPKTITTTQEEVDKQIAAAVEAEKLTIAEAQKLLDIKHQEVLAASKKELEDLAAAKDAEILKLQSAGKDNQSKLEDMIPRVEVEKLISAATEKATSNTIELLQKTKLADEIVTLQASYNLITKEEVEPTRKTLMDKSAASLEADKTMFTKMSAALETHGAAAVDKFKAANLPAGQGSGDGRDFTVGGPKQWGD